MCIYNYIYMSTGIYNLGDILTVFVLLSRWIHDYQDACVDKLEKFISGELSTRSPTGLTLARPSLSKASSLSSAPNSIHGPGARDVFRKATSASFDSLMSPPGCRDNEKPMSKLC